MAKRPPKWEGSEIIKEIDEALDRATARLLRNTQSKLSAASPVLTGRLAASWNIGKNKPDLSAPPERETKGSTTPKPFNGRITYGGDWFISSNLPYTQRAAYDPYIGRRGGGDWFSRIENNLSKDAARIFQEELSQVKDQ